MVTYYRHPNTSMIHMVADFPAPKGNGFSNCGLLPVSLLKPMTKAEVRRAKGYEFCLKCSQLIGLK